MRRLVIVSDGQREARMTVRRRNFVITAVGASAAVAVGSAAPRVASAQGDAWPDKPLRLVVPWPPGGSTDIIARAFQPRLQEALSRPCPPIPLHFQPLRSEWTEALGNRRQRTAPVG